MPGKLSTGLAGEVDEWMFRPQGATEKELLAWTQRRNEELNHNQLDTPERLARHYDHRRKTNRWKGEWKPGWWRLYRPKDLALTLDHARVRIYNQDAFDEKLVTEAAIFILDGPRGTQADREIAQRFLAARRHSGAQSYRDPTPRSDKKRGKPRLAEASDERHK